ncbi:hypothetical protein [Clostridium perfringens]|uniref:hypothetical protein n=1 Tax=Clostridium perfringens TaxID=1502 RepID=UPI001105EBD0|nr:hypothetical protein [Clostridium perfringens]EGT4145465.1 hypothetical protein [Clostridium perfringens]MDK0610371.1 hypothetical protein [Clostridium perfringens]MDM0609268.1 hypothetical protein [Clostridium perfringens]MDM0758059.1 hypothetical protein [Clostridium perfringens]MDM0760977.1 hypothetical protein [Clostridium perfringens]
MEFINMNFYFDEANYDRKITYKPEKNEVNILNSQNWDTFVGVFIGIKKEDLIKFENSYLDFEEKYKNKFLNEDLGKELKGEIIRNKNFKNGFNTFNKDTVEFYSDFFDILINHNCIFQLNCFSKIERVIDIAFNDYKEFLRFNGVYIRPFIYSITKYIYTYKYLELTEKLFLYSESKEKINIIKILSDSINETLEEISSFKRKEREINALRQLKNIFDLLDFNISVNEKIIWDCSRNFEGFNLLLKELGKRPNEISLFLDEDKSNFNAAENSEKYYGKYGKLISCNSKNFIGIRSADILATFFSKLSKASEEELKEDYTNGIKEEVKLINEAWFKINEGQFNLIKKIGVFIYKSCYWSTYFSYYTDYIKTIFYYLHYINSFKSFEEYEKNHNYILANDFIVKSLIADLKKL